MSNIMLLDQNTINKIAAGEVIERPAAVVKELIENAIDAGANAITTEIKEGGISFIRITDNGNGIQKEDIPVAFLRHATSKIKTIEDLLSVSSLGFRGEALSSIASVAQVELVTKTSEALTGVRYLIEGGEEKLFEEIGCPNGTTFIIRNLFFNTPARRKFLKSPTSEASNISELIERLSVSHPNVSFKFIMNNKIKLHTSGNGNLKDIIYNVYGREVSANLLEVDASCEDFSLLGFIGKPVVSRGNRTHENYYINGRYIKSSVISKAIEEAYRPFAMTHRYPFTALHFKINSELIDVNVHPTKMELRFKNNDEIYQFTYHTLKQVLSKKEWIPDIILSEAKKQESKYTNAPEPFEINRIKANDEARRNQRTIRGEGSTYSGKVETDSRVNPNVLAVEKLIYKDRNLSVSNTNNIVDKTEIGRLNHTIDNLEIIREDNNFNKSENLVDSSRNQGASYNTDVIRDSNALNEVEISNHIDILDKTDTLDKTNTVHKTNTFDKTNTLDKTDALDKTNTNDITDASLKRNEQITIFEDKLLSTEAIKNHKIIGQLFSTYWIVQYQEKMFIIDQHAAHEKVLFEKTMNSLLKKEFSSQLLNPPIILSLNMREEEILKTHLDTFTRVGFEIEHFGGKEYSVRAIPNDMFGIAQRELLIEMIDALADELPKASSDLILEKVASMSCKAAVKGNSILSFEEASSLIDQLLELENPYHCPHGRPTIISMSKYEIEKKFKRII